MVLSVSLSASAEGPTPWEVVKETDDGIVVYQREVPGTTVKEVKVSIVIDAPPRQVLDAACDPKSFGESVKYVEESYFYLIGHPNVWYTYQLLNYPIVDKRDYALRYERKIDPAKGVYQLVWQTTSRKGPAPREDVIRVKLATGSVSVSPVGDGSKSRMKFRLLADPGGKIPGWILNIANRINMPDIIRDIRDSALKRTKECAEGGCVLWEIESHIKS